MSEPVHHAARVPLDPVAARDLPARWNRADGAARLWSEPTGGVERELARVLDPWHDLRAVLVRGGGADDGTYELVVVARRAEIDDAGLRDLVHAVIGSGPLDGLRRAAGRRSEPAGEPHPSPVPVVAWGFGDGRGAPVRAVHVPLPPGRSPDPRSWAAALALVLDRYAPEQENPEAHVGLVVRTLDDGFEHLPATGTPFPLTLELAVDVSGGSAGSVSLRYRYRPGVVSPAAADQFVRHLLHVHGEAARRPDVPVGAVSPYDDAELARILALGEPPHPLVHTARRLDTSVAERAAAQPDRVAVSDGAVQLTYRELVARAERLARGLRANGVGDGDRVGVCLDRSVELVAVLLAVVTAGAVFVPLDPASPPQRLQHTVSDAGLRVVVTDAASLDGADGAMLVSPAALDAAAGATGPPARTDGAAGRGPGDPAYVIYTSGSTGRPKGVVVGHDSVTGLVDATQDDFGLRPDDVWTFFHSAAFDFSVWEIWGCLLTGGHLVVVPYWVSRAPEQFRALLAERAVTVLSQTPSAFAQLVAADAGAGQEPLAVRLVVFGGEALDARSVLPWLDRRPGCRFVNMYGITETTVHVTAQDVDRSAALSGSRSVGRALPGWYLRVLDQRGRLVPPGVPGEIHVGGIGLALGYLGRPGLTAERFVADPYGEGRLYRTGDRGRWLPDGRLEHLGRLDHQVKIRGFRIELDEIRSVLAECPGVESAAVVVRRADPDDPATDRIDAYVVADDAVAATGPLRARLSRSLPEYMLPATITAVAVLPLTANGKLDTARLPAPGQSPTADAHPAVPTTGDGFAAELAAVWSRVFGFPVGATDDFFELGGNSLLAVRMSAAMRERGLPALHPRTLYLNPTVGALAGALADSPSA